MSDVALARGLAPRRRQALEKGPDLRRLGVVQLLEYRQRLVPGLPGGRRAAESTVGLAGYTSNLQDMYAWEDYLAPKPMMWQPNGAYQLNEIANNLRGATPLNPSLNINPENWYFVK